MNNCGGAGGNCWTDAIQPFWENRSTSEALLVTTVVVLACAVIVSVQTRLMALQRRLDRLSRMEGKLDAVLKHSGIRFDPLDGLPVEALIALRQGKKIEAIKHYRRATGPGLAEAKDIVEEALRRGAPHV